MLELGLGLKMMGLKQGMKLGLKLGLQIDGVMTGAKTGVGAEDASELGAQRPSI